MNVGTAERLGYLRNLTLYIVVLNDSIKSLSTNYYSIIIIKTRIFEAIINTLVMWTAITLIEKNCFQLCHVSLHSSFIERPERQSARMSKIKNGGLDQHGAEPFEQQQFERAGVERVKGLQARRNDAVGAA